jgi:hypothetical protein
VRIAPWLTDQSIEGRDTMGTEGSGHLIQTRSIAGAPG